MGGAAAAAGGIIAAGSLFLPPPFNVIGVAIGFGLTAFGASQAGSESDSGATFERETRLNTVTIRSADEPHRTIQGTARVGSILNWGTSKGKSNSILQLVLDFGSGPWQGFETIYYNDDAIDVATEIDPSTGEVTGGKYKSGKHFIRLHLGDPDQLADTRAVAEMQGWTAEHRNRGVAYGYFEIPFVQKLYPNGRPEISAVAAGILAYDPRDQQTRFTNNPALLIRHYLLDTAFGMGNQVDPDEIDEDSFIAAANVCDEAVPLTGGGSQARYTCDGTMRYGDRDRMGVMEELLTSCGGILTWSEFKYRLYAAAYRPPALAIDETCLAGDVDWQSFRPWQELYNTVQGKFVDTTREYQLQSFPKVVIAAALAADGKPKVRTIQLPYTQDATRAQRIAKIHALKSRAAILQWPGNMKPIETAIGEPIQVTFPGLLSAATMLPMTYVSDAQSGIGLTLESEDPAMYAWDPGDASDVPESDEPAPDNPAPVVEALSATQTGEDKVQVTWQEVEPRPFGYTIKYAMPGVPASDAILVDNFERGTQIVTASIPPGSWIVYVWTQDEYGVMSDTAASTAVTVINFLDIIEGEPEQPAWPGTLTGWLKHWTGVLRPDSTKLASEMTDEELWDRYTAYPVASSTYEIQERDRGFDAGGVRIYSEIVSVLGPGEDPAGQSTPLFEIDYRLDAEFYDGFEPWVVGLANYRYLKARATQDNAAGLIVLIGFTVVEDIAETTVAVQGESVPLGGKTVLFPARTHAPPIVQATARPDGGALRFAKVDNVTVTGFDCVVVDNTDSDTGGTIDYTYTGPVGRPPS